MTIKQAHSSNRLPWSTYLLVLGQSINLTAAVISVSIAALVGSKLASNPALGTVPYGMQFAAVMLFTYPASILMQHRGRKVGFWVGALALLISGLIGYVAVTIENFALLVAAHTCLGIYIACANFYRFAAVDNLPDSLKGKGISLVVAGGVVAALVGPVIANSLRVVDGYAEFSLCYAAFIFLGAITWVLLYFWRPERKEVTQGNAKESSTILNQLGDRVLPSKRVAMVILVAIFSSASGYFVMNLLMVQSSLVLVDVASYEAISKAIQAHVLAMFAPSFLTGAIISRVGIRQVLVIGFILLICSGIIGAFYLNYALIFIALILLGLGWNFTYVTGGALLSKSVSENNRYQWQGINDSIIAGSATLGAFLPAPLLTSFGWSLSNLLCILICLTGIVACLILLRNSLDSFSS